MKSKRLLYFIITIVVVILGLCSRKFGNYLPVFITNYAGDTLWATMVYFGLRSIFPAGRTWIIGICALLFSYGIELSQLYQASWINAIRATTLGALILGHGFLWTDLVCYTIGVLLGILIDGGINRDV
ncbi:DUF2809 domain-containing protein [Bacteroides sp. OttesenSCG-928-E20]|nr:DUF2809 domain-containing protein [Bacteroides sp. OttesenSCG-928-E20]MDL2304427.1 DUF2809 domain-containing protein [Bacteroides sp. OttesenSCG-928-D19]